MKMKNAGEAATTSAEEPDATELTPMETAAFAEHRCFQAALAEASSYGGGENASGRHARRHKDSSRPSSILPEAWHLMSASLRKSGEVEDAAKRDLLRQQLADIVAKFPS